MNGTCPDFETAATGLEGQTNQQVAISRVVFVNGGASVTLRGVGDGAFNFGDPQLLCSGPELDNCDDEVQGVDDVDDLFGIGQEATLFLDDVDPEGGEIALVNNDPVVAAAPVFAYIAWGEFDSVAPEGGDAGDPPESLEVRADEAGFWVEGERVEVGEDNTIYVLGNGDNSTADGFDTCTGED